MQAKTYSFQTIFVKIFKQRPGDNKLQKRSVN